MNETSEVLGERIVDSVRKADGRYSTTQLIVISFACGVMLGLFIGFAFL